MSVNHDDARDADPVGGNPLVTLVMRARDGDERAWAELVERYAPLIWSICRKHRLGDSDAADVGQNVWLHLADQLDKIRDPAALAGCPSPPPGGNVSGSHGPRRWRTLRGMRSTPGTSPMTRPARPSRS